MILKESVLTSKEINEAFATLQAPDHITDLRKEYWKAGARAAIKAVTDKFEEVKNPK